MSNFLKKTWVKILLALLLVSVSCGVADGGGYPTDVQILQGILAAVIILGVIYIFKE